MPATKPSGIVLYIDGGSRGNPGPAAYAVVVKDAAGNPSTAFSKFLGPTTNNVAEYQGLLAGLDYALRHHHTKAKVFSDSELLVRQIQGRYKVKSPDLKPLHERARGMIARLEAFSIEHVRREQNREADRLVNQALDDADAGAGLRPAPTNAAAVLQSSATYRKGALNLPHLLPLAEGEEVELEIRRKK
ncbi:MAG TPA: ribonuclease HI family protein [Terriglobia bacterium]|nr:ribonuclease HI family protein [Terriglobia bacterium]